MAAMTYRCPIDPDACGAYSAPGYCDRHPTWALEQVRPSVAQPAGTGPAAAVPEPAAGPAQRSVSVRILGRTVPVPAGGLPMGRAVGPLAEVPGVADLTQISRTHAELYWLAGHLYVKDCGSTNGTFIDGEKVTTPRRVNPGQRLRLGLDVDVDLLGEDLDEFGLPR
jgi:FHA domain